MEIRKPARGVSYANRSVRSAGRGLHRERCDRSVLLADDDDAIREVLAEMLGLDGPHDVIDVSDGQEALDYLRSGAPLPGVIVTDLMMPIVSGWELLERVRGEPTLAAIPVIVVSASFARNEVTKAAQLLSKPIRPDHLVEVVGELCEGCLRRKALRTSSA